jgi:hypothetical protein
VELKVATILLAILADFPTPATITLPLDDNISSTALAKSSFNLSLSSAIETDSNRITDLAISNICENDFNFFIILTK